MSETVLYDYWRSTASYRVRIALNLANIDYRSVTVNLLEGEHREKTHLSRNPQGLVPVLEIDGIQLTQSLAIIEYLNETRDLHLLPASEKEKAKIRAMAYSIAMDLHPVCNLRVAKHAASASRDHIQIRDWMTHFIYQGLTEFEQIINGSDFCFGNKLSIVDLCIVPQIYNAMRWGIDLSKFQKIMSIYQNLADHPAFLAAHPEQSSDRPGS